MITARKRKITFRFKLILLACFLVYTGISIYTLQVNIGDLNIKKQELTQQYAQAQEDLSRLEHQNEYMNTDDFIENTAREKLGLAYEGEIILEPGN
jgi:cell division protein DivIC